MTSGRFPPYRPPEKDSAKEKAGADADNALWRIGDWFPKLDPRVAEGLKSYHSELLRFNLKLNLISRQTERDADEVHFADCLMAFEAMDKSALPKQVFDVGSGNGLPGMLFALCDPTREYFLVESDARKSEFLKHIIHHLGIKNCSVVNTRLESLTNAGLKCAVSRGFASISKACLIANKIFPKGGVFYHLKGANWSSEIAKIPSQLISVWSPELVSEYSLPVSQARRAVVRTVKL